MLVPALDGNWERKLWEGEGRGGEGEGGGGRGEGRERGRERQGRGDRRGKWEEDGEIMEEV